MLLAGIYKKAALALLLWGAALPFAAPLAHAGASFPAQMPRAAERAAATSVTAPAATSSVKATPMGTGAGKTKKVEKATAKASPKADAAVKAPSAAKKQETKKAKPASGAKKTGGIDYLVLVNKTHAIPSGWDDAIETVSFPDELKDSTRSDNFILEKKTYNRYLALKKALAQEGIGIAVVSAKRDHAYQQRLVDEYTRDYGADYVRRYVATPGYSEHETGLAIDICLERGGRNMDYMSDVSDATRTALFERVYAKMTEYGFILRYLSGKEAITGYAPEYWHIRYVDSPSVAKAIMQKRITLEEYLGAVPQAA